MKDFKNNYNDINIKVIAKNIDEAIKLISNINLNELLKMWNFEDDNYDFSAESYYDLDTMITIE